VQPGSAESTGCGADEATHDAIVEGDRSDDASVLLSSQDSREEQYAPFLGKAPREGDPLFFPDDDIDLEDKCGEPLMAHQAQDSQPVLPSPVLADAVMSVDNSQHILEDAVMSVGSASSCQEELFDSRVRSAEIEPTPAVNAVNIDHTSRTVDVYSSDSEGGPPVLVGSGDEDFFESEPRETRICTLRRPPMMTKAEYIAEVDAMFAEGSRHDSRDYAVARPEHGKVEPGFVSVPSASEDESSDAEVRGLRDRANKPPTENAKVLYEDARLERSKGKHRCKTNPSSGSKAASKGSGKLGPTSRLLPGNSTSRMDADNEPGSLTCGVASGADDIEQLIGWAMSDLDRVDSLSVSLAMVLKSMSDFHRFRLLE